MIAIIPARGGSKGLPGKNIKMLNDKPLIVHTIDAAIQADGISEIIVTTDSNEIAEISRNAGASVPFIRPKELAGDKSSAIDVYLHAIEYINQRDKIRINSFMVLLPTAPLRTSNQIDEALELFNKSQATTLVSMKEAKIPVSWYYEKLPNSRIKNARFDNTFMNNRQDNKQFFTPNGAIYILDYQLLKDQRTYYCDNTVAYIMDEISSIDIDTEVDFQLAQLYCKN